jgi:hypothetical protein
MPLQLQHLTVVLVTENFDSVSQTVWFNKFEILATAYLVSDLLEMVASGISAFFLH